MDSKKYGFVENDFRRLDNRNRKAYRIVTLLVLWVGVPSVAYQS